MAVIYKRRYKIYRIVSDSTHDKYKHLLDEELNDNDFETPQEAESAILDMPVHSFSVQFTILPVYECTGSGSKDNSESFMYSGIADNKYKLI